MTSSSPVTKVTKSRKSHKKSRLGCDNCKQRRIKCDELFPQCLRCTVHRVECSYQRYSRDQARDFVREKYWQPPTPTSDDSDCHKLSPASTMESEPSPIIFLAPVLEVPMVPLLFDHMDPLGGDDDYTVNWF